MLNKIVYLRDLHPSEPIIFTSENLYTKRILLTTTSLVLAAGVAQADITFSGTAGVALIDDNGASAAAGVTAAGQAAKSSAAAAAKIAADAAKLAADAVVTAAGNDVTAAQTAAATAAATAAGTAATKATAAATAAAAAGVNTATAAARAGRDGMFFESYYDFDITATAESDNGITVSVGFDMGAGNKIDYNDDDVLEAQGVDVGDADVAVSYAGWTLAVDQGGIDNLFDDTDGAQDVSLSGAVGGVSVAVTTDLEGSTNSYKVGGTMAGIALTLTGTNNDDAGGNASGIAASYAMGALTVNAAMSNESDNGEDDTSLGLSYAMDSLTVGYTTIKPGKDGGFGDEWDFSVGYSAGAVAASFALDETDATTIILDYGLGGGASAFAAMHDKAGTDNDLTAVGLNFAF
ncbi:hypothetical protein N9H65_05620 [Planktomarina temperata]|nr:hypothetical protein [Planktomarina temperata]